jgi:hypothetical protein
MVIVAVAALSLPAAGVAVEFVLLSLQAIKLSGTIKKKRNLRIWLILGLKKSGSPGMRTTYGDVQDHNLVAWALPRYTDDRICKIYF